MIRADWEQISLVILRVPSKDVLLLLVSKRERERERAADEEKLRREKKKGGKKRLQRLLFLNTKGAIIFII
jgi:hypothetical protein